MIIRIQLNIIWQLYLENFTQKMKNNYTVLLLI